MKKSFYISPIGQPIFLDDGQELQSAHERSDKAFGWAFGGAAVFLVVVQIIKAI